MYLNNNYIKLRKSSLFYFYYAYIDVKSFLADEFFIDKQVKVKFLRDYQKQEADFIISLVKINKKDEDIFLEALKNLDKNIILVGYNNDKKYDNFKKNLKFKISNFKEEKK